jgi:VanZ family protein
MQVLTKLLLPSALLLCAVHSACSQDLSPRAYVITPRNTSVINLTESYFSGSVALDGAVPITGATAKINVPSIAAYHSLNFFEFLRTFVHADLEPCGRQTLRSSFTIDLDTQPYMSSTQPGSSPRPENHAHTSARAVLPAWLRAWWPAVLWAILISILSTDAFSGARTSLLIEPILRWLYPSISPERLEFAHHLVRKSAHFVEYFIFFLLLYHGIRGTRRDPAPWHWSWALVAWLIAAAYSALDEIHQIFVPSRGPSAWDSLLDSSGALVALLVLFTLHRRFLRPRPN